MQISITKDLGALRASALARLAAEPGVHALKEAEARRVVAGATDAPLLTPEAAARGVTVAVLASAVIAKADAARAALGVAEAERQRRQAAVAAATCPADLDAALKGI
jgi:hypothetical protein